MCFDISIRILGSPCFVKTQPYHTKWGPQTIAKLVNITPITMVYGTQITIVTGVYKPIYNWGGPHCISLYSSLHSPDSWDADEKN